MCSCDKHVNGTFTAHCIHTHRVTGKIIMKPTQDEVPLLENIVTSDSDSEKEG